MPERSFLLQEKFLQENALNLGPFLLQDLAFVILQDGFFWDMAVSSGQRMINQ